MSDQDVTITGAGPAQTGTASLYSGIFGGGSIGYALTPDWALEAEFAYRSVDHDGVELDGGGTLPSGNYASTAVGLNALYSFNLFGSDRVRTYAGLGVAWLTEIDIDFEEAGGEVSYSGDGVGLRALFGARYELGERFFLDAGVRYTAVSSVELDAEEVAIGRIEADYEPWSVPVGFGWRF